MYPGNYPSIYPGGTRVPIRAYTLGVPGYLPKYVPWRYLGTYRSIYPVGTRIPTRVCTLVVPGYLPEYIPWWYPDTYPSMASRFGTRVPLSLYGTTNDAYLCILSTGESGTNIARLRAISVDKTSLTHAYTEESQHKIATRT